MNLNAELHDRLKEIQADFDKVVRLLKQTADLIERRALLTISNNLIGEMRYVIHEFGDQVRLENARLRKQFETKK